MEPKKCVLLYQVQVVSDDVYIGVSLAKPRKWPTQSALTKIPIYAKPPNLFHVFACKNS
jgi:hypothetical protein